MHYAFCIMEKCVLPALPKKKKKKRSEEVHQHFVRGAGRRSGGAIRCNSIETVWDIQNNIGRGRMTLSYSYVPDYFSLTDILCTEERISCKIEVTLPRLGFLDLSSESEDLKPGTKLELPLWLAQPLNKVKESIVSVDIPKTYKEGYREILLADACTVVLNKWNPYYYELGMYLRKFNNRDCEMIIDSLLLTFRSRFRLVMDWAQNPVSDPMLNNLLPRLERDLFLTGRKAKLQLNEWLRKGSNVIETSQSAMNLMKRKRTDYELN